MGQQQATADEHESDSLYYAFSRETSVPTDTLLHEIGPPALYTGMIRTAFRAIDDASRLQFNIPSNAFAAVVLKRTANIFKKVLADNAMYNKLINLSNEIEDGIKTYGIMNGYYLYEVDGYGSYYFMDDGNVPSLISLPYLNYLSVNDSVYLKTRDRLLSIKSNPYYFEGLNGSGIGSPHTKTNWIWPMSIILQAMTSNDDDETMQYTRKWFAWCNNLFGDLILQLIEQRPWLVV